MSGVCIKHVFVTKEKHEFPGCSPTYTARCQTCDMSFWEWQVNIINVSYSNIDTIINENPKMSSEQRYIKYYNVNNVNTKKIVNKCIFNGDVYPDEKKCTTEHQVDYNCIYK